MGASQDPRDFDLALLNMLEARKLLDEYEAVNGFCRSIEHQRLEREFSAAAEQYFRIAKANDEIGENSDRSSA